MRKALRWTWLLWGAGVELVGCSSDPQVIDPPSFDRSERVEWACFDTAKGIALPLDNCNMVEGEILPENIRFHVLVTQSGRGEVGAIEVDFTDAKDSKRVDNDIRVPGYTFPAVGEIPTAVVVAPSHPDYVYTANFGSRDIALVQSSMFRAQTLPPFNAQAAFVPLPEAPTDMVLSPDEDVLFVALPELGAIAVVHINADGSLATPTVVTLSQPVTLDVTLSVEEDVFQKICPPGAPLSEPDPSTPAEPVRCGGMDDCAAAKPRPWALEVDPVDHKLLVADASLPVIHVLDIDALASGNAGAELAPIAVGSPMVDVVLTPPVPRTLGANCDPSDPGAECVRYVYALDAADGSVVAVDYAKSSVLLLHAPSAQRADRVDLGSFVTSLSVVESQTETGELCNSESDLAENAGSSQLRGVFVAAALRSGFVQFIDVWDMDAACRGGEQCDNFSRELGSSVYIRRHHPRLASTSNDGQGLVGTPSVTTASSTNTVPVNGITESELIPDLAPVDACPLDQSRGYPLEAFAEDILVCAVSDPWARRVETWTATWEGTLPDASGGGGVLRASGRVLSASADFCLAGVLGNRDVSASGLVEGKDPEFGYIGDQLLITSELPATAPESCLDLQQEGFSDDFLPLVFAIEEARTNELVLSATTIGTVGATFEHVVECFGELVQYRVAARDAYVVQGTLSGLEHRVIEQDGRCRVDTNADARRQSRAFGGITYTNDRITFKIAPVSAEPAEGEEIIVYFPFESLFLHVNVDAGASDTRQARPGDGTTASSVRFSPINQRLYTVDSALSGVVQYSLTPLAAESFFD